MIDDDRSEESEAEVKQRRSEAAFKRERGGRGHLMREVWARRVEKKGKMNRLRREM